MAFLETPRFPEDISYGASGGPGYSTDVVTVNSGSEQRNANWAQARARYDVAHGLKKQVQLNTLIAFFRSVKGRAHGFRFKDWSDYQVGAGEGTIITLPSGALQLAKVYTTGALTEIRPITKPVTGTVVLAGGGTVDYTTGIVVGGAAGTSWTGEFDVPCRFDTDQMQISVDYYNGYSWNQIPVVELRQS